MSGYVIVCNHRVPSPTAPCLFRMIDTLCYHTGPSSSSAGRTIVPPWSLCDSRAASFAMKISPWSSRIIRLILAFLHPLESQRSTGADRKARRQHGCPLTVAFHLNPTFSSEFFQGLPSHRTRKMGDSGLNRRQPGRRPQNQRGKIKAKPSLGSILKREHRMDRWRQPLQELGLTLLAVDLSSSKRNADEELLLLGNHP